MKTSKEMWEELEYQMERQQRKARWEARRREEALERRVILFTCVSVVVAIVAVIFMSFKLSNDNANEPIQVLPMPSTQEIVDNTNSGAVTISKVETHTEIVETTITTTVRYPASDVEKEMLEGIIAAEGASNWKYSDYLSLATVIINRYNASEFPNTFYDIIVEDLQFDTYANGRYQTVAVSDDCKQAVEDALAGKVNLNNEVKWFCTKEYYDSCGEDDFFKTLDHVYTCRNTYFFTEKRPAY